MSRAWDVGLGSLDEGTFLRCCELFLQHARSLDDGWSWGSLNGSDEGFLKKTVLVTGKINTEAPDGPCRPGENLDMLGEDVQVGLARADEALAFTCAVLAEPSAGRHPCERAGNAQDGGPDDAEGTPAPPGAAAVIRYEYHVLYSSSFQTPMLYFRASTLDGRSLSLEEIWDGVHSNYRQRLLHAPWDSITQQEHPLLGQPFFALHPCRTQEFMSPVLEAARNQNRSLNYIVSWLSTVGPVVGLHIPLSYATVSSEPSGPDPD
ncbi:ubiquitin-like-conjugating enzyme ATG10 isoform X1 [Brienomyrus brachyistius]|uniref:ubiquitin-like-conjugating enzyme ATG10 isoform X1 n=1 Tax=Brienomyrus brachyistius TaxID=42636 RepID=UPI0020B3A1C6|nr:ubiquitin-like-conjugating enzyme ATG10 isoform X1 [Brienomyrus brachyistius]XP_048875233.1 ubiquitin-like-conjugating enzyme ATG10 isoform X1 [Brienomyrus brachyistius]